MKAKEYIQEYKNSSDKNSSDKKEVTVKILLKLTGELTSIQEARRAQSDRAMVAIFHEVNQKWKSIAKKIDEPESMFWEVLKIQMPDLMLRIPEK